MKKIFYEKVGRKYVPVYEYDQTLMDAFPKGSHLVVCYPGGRSTRYNVDPAYGPMIAAGRVAEDVISTAIYKASEVRNKERANKPLTPEQKAAWEHLVKVLGDDAKTLNYNSARDIAEAGVKAMQEEAMKLMEHPSVKKSYEHFLLICELTKENNNESNS
jgi:hypothetical protein